MISRMLAWIRSPGAGDDEPNSGESPGGPVGLDDPMDRVSVDGARPEIQAGFSSSALHASVLAHADNTLGYQPRLLLRAGEAAPLPHSPYLAAAMQQARAKIDEAASAPPPEEAASWLDTGAHAPRGLSSLHPADYDNVKEFGSSVFSRQSSGRGYAVHSLNGSLSAGPRTPVDELDQIFFSQAVDSKSLRLHPQWLHLLNVAYVNTVRDFAGISNGHVRIDADPFSSTAEYEQLIVETHEADITSSTSLSPTRGSGIKAAFIGEDGQVKESVNLNGVNLFSLSRHIEDALDTKWRDRLKFNVEATAKSLVHEIALALGDSHPQLRAALMDNAVDLGLRIAQLFDTMSPFLRLSSAAKAFVPLPSLNSALKEFNSTLDRGAISLALRFGNMRLFTHSVYETFRDPTIRDAIERSGLPGAWQVLAVSPEVLTKVTGQAPKNSQKILTALKAMHEAMEPAVRERVSKEKVGYFFGFRSNGAVVRNRVGANLGAKSFESLPHLLEANLADPAMVGRILGQAFNWIAQEAGIDVGLKSLAPPTSLMCSRPLMEILANARPGEQLFALDHLGLDEPTRVRAAAHILRDAADNRLKRSKDDDAAPTASSEFTLGLNDFISAPSYRALQTYRGVNLQEVASQRARSSALRSLLGMTAASKDPITTRVDKKGSARGKQEWKLAMVRSLGEYPLKSAFEYRDPEVLASGSTYQLSFRSEGVNPAWVHMTLLCAHHSSQEVDFKSALDISPDLHPLLAFGPKLTKGTHEAGTLRAITLPMTTETCNYGSNQDESFFPIVGRRDLKRNTRTQLVTDVLYRGIAGTGQLFVDLTERKLGSDSRKALMAHAGRLAELVHERLARGARRDPMLFAATMGGPALDLTQRGSLLANARATYATEAAMRCALVAGATGAVGTIREAAARMIDPFKRTSRGASILDIAEGAQTPSRPGLAGNADGGASAHVERALQGVQLNPAAQADPEMLVAMVERSAPNILAKQPELLEPLISMGLKPKVELLSMLDSVHPGQVSEDVSLRWAMHKTIAAQTQLAQAQPGQQPGDAENGAPQGAAPTRRRRSL